MNIHVLRQTVHTYKDDELATMFTISRWMEAKTKENILVKEIERREQERASGTYVDKTLPKKLPIKKRLQLDQ